MVRPVTDSTAKKLVIPYSPHSGGQIEFHANIEKRVRVLACGARFGKDRATVNETWKVASILAANKRREMWKYKALIPLVHVWVVAPDYPRLKQFWMELLHYIPAKAIVKRNDTTHELRCTVTGGDQVDILIELKSAKNPDSLVSSGIDLMVLTEAALIKDEAWDYYLQPRLISPGRSGIVLANGTPKGRNWFYRLYKESQRSDRPDMWGIQASSWMNPHIDRKWLRMLKRNMPTLAYQQEIMAEFVSESGGVFHGVRDAAKVVLPFSGPVVIGIDWGKVHDATVFYGLAHSGKSLPMHRITKTRYQEQLTELDEYIAQIREAHELPLDQIVIAPERNSIGEPLLEQLNDRYPDNVIPFRTDNPSKGAIVDQLALDIEAGTINLDNNEELLNELEIFEYKFTKMRNVSYGSPVGNYHDDCVMACAIANWHRHLLQDYGSPSRVRAAKF